MEMLPLSLRVGCPDAPSRTWLQRCACRGVRQGAAHACRMPQRRSVNPPTPDPSLPCPVPPPVHSSPTHSNTLRYHLPRSPTHSAHSRFLPPLQSVATPKLNSFLFDSTPAEFCLSLYKFALASHTGPRIAFALQKGFKVSRCLKFYCIASQFLGKARSKIDWCLNMAQGRLVATPHWLPPPPAGPHHPATPARLHAAAAARPPPPLPLPSCAGHLLPRPRPASSLHSSPSFFGFPFFPCSWSSQARLPPAPTTGWPTRRSGGGVVRRCDAALRCPALRCRALLCPDAFSAGWGPRPDGPGQGRAGAEGLCWLLLAPLWGSTR